MAQFILVSTGLPTPVRLNVDHILCYAVHDHDDDNCEGGSNCPVQTDLFLSDGSMPLPLHNPITQIDRAINPTSTP